jgi:hypothetical protein
MLTKTLAKWYWRRTRHRAFSSSSCSLPTPGAHRTDNLAAPATRRGRLFFFAPWLSDGGDFLKSPALNLCVNGGPRAGSCVSPVCGEPRCRTWNLTSEPQSLRRSKKIGRGRGRQRALLPRRRRRSSSIAARRVPTLHRDASGARHPRQCEPARPCAREAPQFHALGCRPRAFSRRFNSPRAPSAFAAGAPRTRRCWVKLSRPRHHPPRAASFPVGYEVRTLDRRRARLPAGARGGARRRRVGPGRRSPDGQRLRTGDSAWA